MESRIRDPKPSIAVHNNGTHLLLKLAKGDQEHCAALVARPSAPDNEQDDDATEITLHLNQVSAVGLDPSAFLSDVDPKFYGVFGVLSTSSGHYLGLISKVRTNFDRFYSLLGTGRSQRYVLLLLFVCCAG